jgi:hypothetical protein
MVNLPIRNKGMEDINAAIEQLLDLEDLFRYSRLLKNN